jgi:hypothetical protein
MSTDKVLQQFAPLIAVQTAYRDTHGKFHPTHNAALEACLHNAIIELIENQLLRESPEYILKLLCGDIFHTLTDYIEAYKQVRKLNKDVQETHDHE